MVTKILQFVREKKIILIVIFILLIGLFIFILTSRSPGKKPLLPPDTNNPTSTNSIGIKPNVSNESNKSIYYAKTTPAGSEVYAFSGGINTKVATLPTNIREITPLTGNRFLFVNNLSFLDRGQRIDLYNTTEKQILPFTDATAGFLIENYVLSPREDGIVFWEVEKNATTTGKTHIVYQSLTDRSIRKILIDESLSDQTKYPVLWGVDDTIYMDSYSVQRKGIHQGLFTITSKDPATLKLLLSADTYSSIPILSPDGTRLVYTAYDPQARIQLSPPLVPNGLFRSSIRNPNQIAIFDKQKKIASIIRAGKNGEIFSGLVFRTDAKSILYKRSIISGNSVKDMDIRLLDIDKTGDIPDSPFLSRTDGIIVGQLGSRYILAFPSGAMESLGGIDTSYSPVFGSTYLYDENGKYEQILSDDPVQIIGVL